MFELSIDDFDYSKEQCYYFSFDCSVLQLSDIVAVPGVEIDWEPTGDLPSSVTIGFKISENDIAGLSGAIAVVKFISTESSEARIVFQTR